MTFDSLLIQIASLQTYTSSQNALGEWLQSYTTVSTPFSCRMSPLSNMERIDTTGRYDDVRYKCFTVSSTAIGKDNRVLFNGTVYRVKETIMDSEYHHKTSLLMELH